MYEGYSLHFSSENYFFSWLVFFAAFFWISPIAAKVSDYFFIMAATMLFAPLTSFYGLSGREIFPVLVTLISVSFIYFIVSFKKIKVPSMRYIHKGDRIAVSLSLFFVLYLVCWYLISGAAFNMNFDISKIYEYRSQNSQRTNIGILSYINSWVYQVFCLFLITYFLYVKKIFFVVLFVLVQVFFFSVSAHKSILLYPFMVIGIWSYYKKYTGLAIVPTILSLVVIIGLLLFILDNDVLFGSMLIRRVFYVPAILTYSYLDFFSENNFLYWSNSILSLFVEYPFTDGVAILIGEYVGSGSSANNGYISSGYSHAGLTGVLIYSFLLGYILKFIDVISSEAVPLWFALSITAIPLRSALLSSDLLTTLLTHGLLVSISLLLLMRTKGHLSKMA